MDKWLLRTYNEKEDQEEGFVLYISAPRGSGKTYLLVNLLVNPLLYNGRFDQIFFFCPSFYDDPKYSVIDVPSSHVFEKFNENKIKALLKNKKRDEHYLFVFDDCIAQENFKKNSGEHVLNEIAVNGRHMGVSIIMTSQKTTGASSFIRSQADGVIIFKARSLTELETIYQDNSVGTISKKEFIKLVDHCTNEQYSFLYINYQSNTIFKNFNIITL